MSEHQSPIKTPKQLVTVIALSFIVPIIIILLLVNYVDFSNKEGSGSNSMSKEQIVKRIAPVAQINYKDPNAPIVYKKGEEVYQSLCISCHGTGAAGAPKLGNIADWTTRLGQGFDGLLHSLLQGKGAMQPRAGAATDDYSDYELARAVVYLVNSSGGKLAQPQEPAPSAKTTNLASETSIENAAVDSTSSTLLQGNTNDSAQAAKEQPSSTGTSADSGKKLYEQACVACHATGAAGAPKLGDKTAWDARISTGKDALYKSAINGKNAMPAKGGSSATDAEVKAAVDYMLAAIK